MSQEPSLPAESRDVTELSGRITSWRDFGDRVSAAMAMAAAEPVSITMTDTNFVRWPLGQRSVMEAFQQWAVHGSSVVKCHVLAGTFEEFARSHPRWLMWRANWSHRVICQEAPEELASQVRPMLVLHGRLGLRLVEERLGTGVWTRDPGVLSDWLSDCDAISQRSHDGMPPTTLGL